MEKSKTIKIKPKRRPLQIVIRWTVIVLVLLVAAWAFMPLWLPINGITRSLCSDIEHRTGLKVSFASVDASWGKGLVLRDFIISSPQGFDAAMPMIQFRRLHCDFSPIRMLLGMKVDWCEIEGLQVNAEVDAAGKLNLGAFRKLQEGDSGGGLNFGRISLTGSTFTLDIEGNPQKLTLGVRNLQLVSGRVSRIEQMTMTADVEQTGQAAPVNLQLSAKGGSAPDVAGGMLNFVNVDLSQIPLPTTESGFPLKSLGGRCDGSFRFHVNKSLQVESLTLDLTLNKLAIVPAAGEPFKEIPQVTFKTQAALDAIDEGLDISGYEFEMPGLKITGSGDLHSEFFAGNWRGLEFLKIAGVVEPQKLREIAGKNFDMPERLDGVLNVKAYAGISERTLKFNWDVDATNACLSRDDEIVKPLGDAMSMSFAGGINLDDDKNTLAVDKLSVNFGSNVLTGGGRIENLASLGDLHENYRGALEILRRMKLRGTMQLAVAGPESPLNGTWSVDGGERIHVISTLMADDKTPLTFDGVFSKPAGKSCHVDVIATINPCSGELEKGLLELSCGEAAVQINDLRVFQPDGMVVDRPVYHVEGKIDGKRLEELACFLPCLNGDMKLSGDFSGTLKGTIDEDLKKPELAMNINLNKTDIRSGDNFIKKLGDDFNLDVAITAAKLNDKDAVQCSLSARDAKDSAVIEVLLQSISGKPGEQSPFKITLSNVGMLRKYSPQLLRRMNIDDAKGAIAAQGNCIRNEEGGFDYSLGVLPDKVALSCDGEDLKMNGEITLAGKVSKRKTQRLITGELDAAKFDFTFNGDVKKTVNMPAKISWELAVQDDFIDKGGMMHLRSLVGVIGENRFQLAGVINATDIENGKSPDFSGSDLHLAVNLIGPQTFAALLPGVAKYKPEGGAFVDVQLTAPARDEWLVSTATFKGEGLSGVYNKRRVTVNGSLKFSDVLIKAGHLSKAVFKADDGFGFSVDGENGYLLADLSVADSVPMGKVSVLMDRFDLKDFADWLAGPNQPQSRPAKLTFSEKEDIKKQADEIISQFVKQFAKADLTAKFAFDSFIGYDQSVDKSYLFDKVYATLVIHDGKLAFDYNGGLAGGVSRGSYACNFLSPEPRIVWDSGIIDVQATTELMPQINKDFPGNTVEGTFTNVVKVYSRLRDFLANRIDDRYPLLMVGEGKMTAKNGYVVGKAAPAFVTKMFPGLNLTKYYYQKMTAYQEFQSNGVCINDAIFSGKSYDVYMNGTTDLDKNIEYTLGLQLLGSLSSADWKHDWRQGRLPLLKLKGRIEKGKLLDDVVTFPWPNETLGAIFIKNNVFYRAWLLKKGEQ